MTTNTTPKNTRKVNQTTGDPDNIAPRVPVTEQAAEAANSPTVTGFTKDDPGHISAEETDGLRRLDLDEATKLRAALDQVIGYQTGITYRNDFTSGLETLRTFGFGYDTDRADADATKVQEEVFAKEADQAHSED